MTTDRISRHPVARHRAARRWLAAGVVAVAAVLASAGVASAAPSLTSPAGAGVPRVAPSGAGVDVLKAAVTTRIDLRLATLNALKIAVNGATDLTATDKSTLNAVISADLSGLGALKTKVAGETTVAALKDDAKSMVQDYRVYMLVVPKVRLSIAADKETTVIGKLQGVHDQLVKVATTLAGEGKDVSAVNATLADMQAKLDSAKSTITGVAATLLAVNPSPDPNAMKAATGTARTAVRTTRGDLRTAATDAKSARDALKALGG